MRPFVDCDLRPDSLQRDTLAERAIVGFIELAHAATCDETRHEEAIAQEIADAKHHLARGFTCDVGV